MAQFKCEICDLEFEQRSKFNQPLKASRHPQTVSTADSKFSSKNFDDRADWKKSLVKSALK